MRDNVVARRYAQALFELASAKACATLICDNLQNVKDTLANNQELQAFFDHALIAPEAKKDIVKELFAGQLEAITLDFLFVLIDKKREPYLINVIEAYQAFVDEANGLVEAELRTSFALSAEEIKKIKEDLGQSLQKKVRLSVKQDPALLGSAVLKIGDKVIDGSVLTRLKNLKQSVLSSEVRK
jgi:F-type H+-transporting ATPase subunit delta